MAKDLVTLAEYKAYAGISSTNQDSIISSLIPQVSSLVRSICRRTFTEYVDDFKTDTFSTNIGGMILLKETPLIMVSSVEYSEDYGKTYTELVEFEDFVVNVETDAIEIIAGALIDFRKTNAFKVTYTAGYEVLPNDLKLAILDLVTYYLRNDAAIKSSKALGSNTVQIEYITNTQLPAHIRRVLDLHTSSYI